MGECEYYQIKYGVPSRYPHGTSHHQHYPTITTIYGLRWNLISTLESQPTAIGPGFTYESQYQEVSASFETESHS